MWSQGFESLESQELGFSLPLLWMQNAVIPPLIVANIPQLLLSVVYLSYNGLLTSLLLNQEYISYSQARKPLRVSEPREGQYSTYYLQIPYGYAIPLMTWSIALHYFISQALYFERLIYFHKDDSSRDVVEETSNATVLNALGLFCVGVTGLVGAIILFSLGFRRYPDMMPIGGTCSASIAAACWRPENDGEAAIKELMWGELKLQPTDQLQDNTETLSFSNRSRTRDDPIYHDTGEVRHLCFTTFPVVTPQANTLYI